MVRFVVYIFLITHLFLQSSCTYDHKIKGLKEFEDGNYLEARFHFTKVINLEPQDWSTMYNLARTYEEIGEYEKSRLYYTKTLRLQPYHIESFLGRGRTYWKDSLFNEAYVDLKNTVMYAPQMVEAQYLLGVCLLKLGENKEALEALENCLELDRNHLHATYHRGIARARTGDIFGAIYDFGNSIKEDKDFMMAYYNRAKCFMAINYWRVAINDLNKAIELSGPEDAFARRGYCYLMLKDMRRACRDFAEAHNKKVPYAKDMLSDHCR
ncbi:MAG: tetratricopeptide repeat protein [Cyclobacteriaceae bacterium]|nr:tetratricopeptide repeat protein [Cyclobacteriaceae bacterium]